MSSTVTARPAGNPSMMTTRPWPWDSPAVRNLSTGGTLTPRRHGAARELGLGGGAHHADVGRLDAPQLLLQGSLLDEHPEPVERARSDVASGAQQGGVERVIDEVGHELLGTKDCRVERDLVGAEADRGGVDEQSGGAEFGTGVLGDSPGGR